MSRTHSLIFAFVLATVGIASRLLPHTWNTTPITAIALFASAYLGFRYSFGIFLVTMVFADIFLGFYQWQIMVAVYGSFVVASVIGLCMKKRRTIALVFGSALTSSLIFFLITNWAVWQFGALYDHSFNGLIQCYFMALPFFKNSLAGDIFYTCSLFGAYELFVALSRKPVSLWLFRKTI